MTEQLTGSLEPVNTVPEIAAMLRVSPTKVLRLIAVGEFGGAFKTGREWRVPASARDSYFRKIGYMRAAAAPIIDEPLTA